ncbi:SOS response-associated peptidase family protein, partial [Mycobacterium tuberculosis]|uniref:SOS response-associated peptidase family protein n=1 Tax=Mycobacterium tuberculosis TaxID=1773 RepID=UPI0032B58552
MCGRFAVTTDPAQLAEKITAIDEATGCGGGKTSYNVAPTDTIATVVSRHSEPGGEPTRRVRPIRVGLIPSWIKDGPGGTPLSQGPPLEN